MSVYRILVIFLLALLPFQFTWAAVESYCGHEAQSEAVHFGHHEHEHSAIGGNSAEPIADQSASADDKGDKSPGVMDVDCGHCHGTCSAIPSATSELFGMLSLVAGHSGSDEANGVHTSARPERPQWLPLA